MSTTLAALTTAAIEEREDATRAAELAQHSMRESDRTLEISPNNVNYWKTRTKIFYSFSSFNPDLNKAAIDALKQAQSLSPTDPKIDYNLAILYGHEGDNGLAIDYLTQAITLKPNYRDAYYALFVFYTDTKQLAPAREILTKYLEDVDPNDRDFQDRLNQL
jgi:tetratricopeptide (TPR) repeat protein